MSTAPGNNIRETVERCARAQTALRSLTGQDRQSLLMQIARSIRDGASDILEANALDLEASSELSGAMRDRLLLDESRIESMARAVEAIAHQRDPIGSVVDGRVLSNGIKLEKRRVPLGVVLMIYESRPNVTSDAAALCLRSGNAVVLKGGREALHSNLAIARCLDEPLREAGAEGAVLMVERTDRVVVQELLALDDLIDLAIPRGGRGLMEAVVASARMPVVKHDAGVCHLYIDEHLDGLEDDAISIMVNSKAQRPGVCNALETLLVHESQAVRMLPRAAKALGDARVELRGDERTRELVPEASPASDEDWRTEYLDLIISIRVVRSLDEACAHIARYGSGHTDGIVTSSISAAERFTTLTDSASVMINCSTRFADGGEYGLGAEIGISTEKLHARGPMGAADLTTFQWVLVGSGQIRQ